MGMRPTFLTSNSSDDHTGSIDQVPVGICVAAASAMMDIANSFASVTIEYATNIEEEECPVKY
jgi:hypothetical protein